LHHFKIINIFIDKEEKTVSSMPLSNIKKYLSKIQQDIYNLDNQNYNVSIDNTLVSLQIGSNIYNWHLHEIYFQDDLPIENKFITGHSVIIYDK
jgi:predicted transcriptional regulator